MNLDSMWLNVDILTYVVLHLYILPIWMYKYKEDNEATIPMTEVYKTLI